MLKSIYSKIIIALVLVLFSHPYASADSKWSNVRDIEGWTIFEPKENVRIAYVSHSSGDDNSGQIYLASTLDYTPFKQHIYNKIKPFRTFKAAFEANRSGQADWILIKRGETFQESIRLRNGKSITIPFLVAAYGESNLNPIFKTGNRSAFRICCNNKSNIAIQGVDFYASTRDPSSSDYKGPQGDSGFNIYINKNQSINNLLIEGNRFRYYTGNVIQGPGKFEGVTIRRNSFLDSYSTNSHSTGLYSKGASLRLEENIFDHNGWLANSRKVGNRELGAATMYNHNTYFENATNTIFSGNIFMRSSSMHNKWTSDAEAGSKNVLIKNNLYIDGEIGISAGTNNLGSRRFTNFKIINNVLLGIGKSNPTNRGVSWGMEVKGWDIGLIEKNLFINQINKNIKNVLGISLLGENSNVTIKRNEFINLRNATYLNLGKSENNKNIRIIENKFRASKHSYYYALENDQLDAFQFNGNKYQNIKGDCNFYKNNTDVTEIKARFIKLFNNCINGRVSDWLERSKEENIGLEYDYENTILLEDKSIIDYQLNIGSSPSIKSFIEEIRSMSMNNWKKHYTATKINGYFLTN